MTNVQIRNFDGVIVRFPINEVDHIQVRKPFDVELSRKLASPHTEVVEFFKDLPKSHRILEVFVPTKATLYYFDADRVWVSFE